RTQNRQWDIFIRIDMISKRKITTMRTIGQHRVMNSNQGNFILIFVDQASEFFKKIFPGFNETFFVNVWMPIPILNKPLTVNRDNGYFIVYFNSFNSSIFPWHK